MSADGGTISFLREVALSGHEIREIFGSRHDAQIPTVCEGPGGGRGGSKIGHRYEWGGGKQHLKCAHTQTQQSVTWVARSLPFYSRRCSSATCASWALQTSNRSASLPPPNKTRPTFALSLGFQSSMLRRRTAAGIFRRVFVGEIRVDCVDSRQSSGLEASGIYPETEYSNGHKSRPK